MENTRQFPEIVPAEFRGAWRWDVTSEQYHADKTAMSRSGLVEMDRSPAHFLANFIEGSTVVTAALRFGQIEHEALLEPKKYLARVRVRPDFGDLRTKEAKANRDAWQSDLPPDALLVSAEEHEQVHAMIDKVWSHPVASQLLDGARPEATGYFRDPISGVKCRVRVDAIRAGDRVMVDVKGTSDASKKAFQRAIANYKYHFQAGFYTDAAAELKTPVDDFVIIATEKTKPYAVAVYVLEQGAVKQGRQEYRSAMARYLECLQANRWPAYTERAEPITLPQWAFTEEAA